MRKWRPSDWAPPFLEEENPRDSLQYRAYSLVYKLLSLHTLLRIREGTKRKEEILRRFYDHLEAVVELVAEGMRKRKERKSGKEE